MVRMPTLEQFRWNALGKSADGEQGVEREPPVDQPIVQWRDSRVSATVS